MVQRCYHRVNYNAKWRYAMMVIHSKVRSVVVVCILTLGGVACSQVDDGTRVTVEQAELAHKRLNDTDVTSTVIVDTRAPLLLAIYGRATREGVVHEPLDHPEGRETFPRRVARHLSPEQTQSIVVAAQTRDLREEALELLNGAEPLQRFEIEGLPAISDDASVGRTLGIADQERDESRAGSIDVRRRSFGTGTSGVTIYEFTSLSCRFCQHFHQTAWPFIREDLRNGDLDAIWIQLPLNRSVGDTQGQMLLECVDPSAYARTLEALYSVMAETGSQGQGEPSVQALSSATSMSSEDVLACLTSREKAEAVEGASNQATRQLGINATPTFLFSGPGGQVIVAGGDLDPGKVLEMLDQVR